MTDGTRMGTHSKEEARLANSSLYSLAIRPSTHPSPIVEIRVELDCTFQRLAAEAALAYTLSAQREAKATHNMFILQPGQIHFRADVQRRMLWDFNRLAER